MRTIQLGLFGCDLISQDRHLRSQEPAIVGRAFDACASHYFCHGADVVGNEIDGLRMAKAGYPNLNHTFAWNLIG